MGGFQGFITEILANRSTVGAIAPSTPMLARAITRPARDSIGQRRWLEVGPGTGVFTRRLIGALHEGDHLDVVELNSRFCRHLRKSVLPVSGGQVTLHEGSIEDVNLAGAYDGIVCGLPYNIFPTHVSRSIIRRLVSMLKEDGTLSFFEYAAIRNLRRVVGNKDMKRTSRWHARFVERLQCDMESSRELVLMNLPPAWAVHLSPKKTGS